VARSWLERVGADGLGDRRPGSLSGGQRQRVALARGLAGDPGLVLLDEPLSALDLAVRRELRGLIREVITSTGVPALLVTHDADEAEELGDVIIGYGDGHVTGTRAVDHPARPRSTATVDEGTAPA
jgi:ABC-type sulfate/molybdate transport systems ATPase subunit